MKGRGHILEHFMIRDPRIRRLQADQPINLTVITLHQDPGLNSLSNLPGTPVDDVTAGGPVDVLFEPIVGSDQLIPEWWVVKQPSRFVRIQQTNAEKERERWSVNLTLVG